MLLNSRNIKRQISTYFCQKEVSRKEKRCSGVSSVRRLGMFFTFPLRLLLRSVPETDRPALLPLRLKCLLPRVPVVRRLDRRRDRCPRLLALLLMPVPVIRLLLLLPFSSPSRSSIISSSSSSDSDSLDDSGWR